MDHARGRSADGLDFKDSWASNLSVGTTIFVALFGSDEILKAILGDAPDETSSHNCLSPEDLLVCSWD